MKYTAFNPRKFEAHRTVYDVVPAHARVLDLGCATGYFARELRKKHCSVVGVENDPSAARLARRYCEQIIIGDLECPEKLPIPRRSFDVVLLLDVLEHIVRREKLLAAIRTWIKPSGVLILSTPNIVHISIRLRVLLGNFTYQRWGILDETHVHFFTQPTLREALEKADYFIEKMIPTADFGQLPLIGRYTRFLPKHLQFFLTQLLPNLLGVQWVARCRRRYEEETE